MTEYGSPDKLTYKTDHQGSWCWETGEHESGWIFPELWSVSTEHRPHTLHNMVFECQSVMSHSSVIPWTISHHAPLSIEFSRHESWNGLPFPENLPDSGIDLASLASPALAGAFFTTVPHGKPLNAVGHI